MVSLGAVSRSSNANEHTGPAATTNHTSTMHPCCAVRPLWVSIDAVWEDATGPGEYRYWVKVDSTGSIDESDESDNVTSGVVLRLLAGTHLPLVSR